MGKPVKCYEARCPDQHKVYDFCLHPTCDPSECNNWLKDKSAEIEPVRCHNDTCPSKQENNYCSTGSTKCRWMKPEQTPKEDKGGYKPMMKKMAYKAENNIERCTMIAILCEREGFKFEQTKGFFTQADFETWPVIIRDNVKKEIRICRSIEGDVFVDKKTFMQHGPEPTVKLNDKYTARLFKECIVVGCQEIGYENLKALYNASQGYLPHGPTVHPR